MEELSRKAKRREERRMVQQRNTTRRDEQKETSYVQKSEKAWVGKLKQYYDAHYMRLLWIPILLAILAAAQIGYQYATTGSYINKGVSLKGGVIVTLQQSTGDITQMETVLRQQFPGNDIDVRALTQRGERTGTIIEADLTQEQINPLKSILEEKLSLKPGEYTIEFIGSTLGESFFRQTMVALIIAFVLMSIVVFIAFRVGAPAFFVIIAAVCDMLETVAIFNLLGEKLTAAGIASFLMLIGYSIDTDVLLTTRVTRRREGTITDATFDACLTGLTMAAASIAAVFLGWLLTTSDVLRQIFLIIMIGLILDIINTWLQNAAILKWWLEERGKKKHHAAHPETGVTNG